MIHSGELSDAVVTAYCTKCGWISNSGSLVSDCPKCRAQLHIKSGPREEVDRHISHTLFPRRVIIVHDGKE